MSANAAVRRADGAWVVPGNRWDLIDADLLATDRGDIEVSVVVPWYRDQAGLDLVLAALAQQTHPRLQIVVADDGSPQPPHVPSDVVVVRQERRGFRAAAARNLGARAADGAVLCFLDADTVPEPDYVARAVARPAVAPDVLVVGRRRHADLTGWTPARWRSWRAGPGSPPAEFEEPGWLRDAYRDSADLLRADDRSYRFVISAVLTVHREMFDAARGFDETFTAYGGEDWDFAHRAMTAGAVLVHEPHAVAWHDGPDWAARLEPADARRQKNAELRTLAARIPDRAARGGGSWPDAPTLLVVLPADADDDAWWLCVRAFLAAGDDLVVQTAVRVDDTRVVDHAGPGIHARARVLLEVHRPVLPGRAWLADLLGRLTFGGPGRLDTADGSVTAWAQRARNRARRHGIELPALFDTATVPAPAPVTDDPVNLGRWLPRLPLD